jgi:hypothetical protein
MGNKRGVFLFLLMKIYKKLRIYAQSKCNQHAMKIHISAYSTDKL